MVGVDSRRDAADHSLAALPVSPLALCAQGVGPGLPGTGLPFRGARPGQLLEPAGRLAGGGLRSARFGLRTVVSERADRSRAPPCGRGHRRRAARRKPARGDLPAAGRLVAQGRAVRLSHLRPPGGCPSVHHRQRRPRLRRGALQHQGVGRLHPAPAGQPGGRRQGRGGGAIRLLRLPPWPGRAAGLGRRRDRRDAVHRLAGVAAGRAGKRAVGGAALLRAQFPGSAVRRALARALRTLAQRDPAHPL